MASQRKTGNQNLRTLGQMGCVVTFLAVSFGLNNSVIFLRAEKYPEELEMAFIGQRFISVDYFMSGHCVKCSPRLTQEFLPLTFFPQGQETRGVHRAGVTVLPINSRAVGLAINACR